MIRIWAVVLLVCMLPGCWSKFELTERGFAQALAIDVNEKGIVELVTHFYNPSGGGQTNEGRPGGSSINIRTTGQSVFEAVRDIPIHLGRKAQWSHLRVVMIGEEAAKRIHVGNLLDFLLRDHEPRSTISILVTQGLARDSLEVKPIIENTMGQQLKEINETAYRYTGKTLESTLLEVLIQLKSASQTAKVPYMYISAQKPSTTVLAGVALLKDGLLVEPIMKPSETELLLLLTNKYRSGIVHLPCSSAGKPEESFEIRQSTSRMKPSFGGDRLEVKLQVKIRGSLGELHCSSALTSEEEMQISQKVNKTLQRNANRLLTRLQQQQIDAIELGNFIAAHDPNQWKKLKDEWGQHFAKAVFDIEVETEVTGTGMLKGAPSFKATKREED
ncbi:Ger(x)C family spore germination protein [Paenibacillus sp. YYML68]|uniref:Ger(x)C family spore germination protein n=1 Tax=Paenibacillus sp. YYML68 TaxID=2909250 RepID=UPI00249039F1|nr:Ger(x)C family spore germination protein [Paenibacillus sp. YYML68]